jgi:hypothetical protein
MATAINTDSLIETVNAFIPILIIFMFLGMIFKALSSIHL